jgi:hypothetical protein
MAFARFLHLGRAVAAPMVFASVLLLLVEGELSFLSQPFHTKSILALCGGDPPVIVLLATSL